MLYNYYRTALIVELSFAVDYSQNKQHNVINSIFQSKAVHFVVRKQLHSVAVTRN